MAVRKRGNRWLIDYYEPGGRRIIKGGFKTKKAAEAEEAKRKSLIAEDRYLDVKKDYQTTLEEILLKYEENYKHQVSFQTGKWYMLDNFRSYFGKDTRLSDIRYVDLETYRNRLRNKPAKHGGFRADSSVNKEMSCLHHIFNKAVEWEMAESNPFDRGKTLLLKENNQRLRYLTEEEVPRLLAECSEYLHPIVVCAINTGMRRGEILDLKWEQIRGGWIYLQRTKTQEPRQVPVNDELVILFKHLRRRHHFRSEYVFQDKGRAKFKRVEKGFNAACKRAGIEDSRFHDLRHTFASHMIMRGASLKEIQEILGHKNLTMTMRYAHLSQEKKKQAVNLLSGLTGNNLVTSENVNERKSLTIKE